LDLERKQTKLLGESPHDAFFDLAWSPDSRWLAYAVAADNQYTRIWCYHTTNGTQMALTSDRVYSHNPAWSPDGKWLYFLSDRHLQSTVGSPWGPRQPEPHFDKTTKIYLAALTKDQRSPFEPADELHPSAKDKDKDKDKHKDKDKKDDQPAGAPAKEDKSAKKKTTKNDGAAESEAATNKNVEVTIDWDGLATRLWEVPVPPGNYSELSINDKRLFWISRDGKSNLQVLDINNEEPKPKTLGEDIRSYELSADGKKLLIRKGDAFHIEDATGQVGEESRLEELDFCASAARRVAPDVCRSLAPRARLFLRS
jgi:tricorn protease